MNFFYYMYGVGMGILRMFVEFDVGVRIKVVYCYVVIKWNVLMIVLVCFVVC